MGLGHLFDVFEFLDGATHYVSPDSDTLSDLEESERLKQIADHRRVVTISKGFGLAGAATGVALLFYAATLKEPVRELPTLLMAPLIFAVEGLVWGVSIALFVAPHDFLTGPVGQKWLKLVGTTDVVLARCTCFFIAFLITALVTFIVWAGFQPPGPLF